MQVDDTISRISDILKNVKNVRNSLQPISKLPPETLALVAEFLEPKRQLVNATAVCQHWRATLLSFPRLWSTIRCSNRMQFEAYLERSKSTPLDVRFHNIYPHLLESLLPHTSRLATLTVQVSNSSDFGRIAQHLRCPIPRLRKFSILASRRADAMEFPSSTPNNCFVHVKELELQDISSLRAPHAFPHVTKLTWHVGPEYGAPVELPGLLDTLEQLPVLEEVGLVFRESRDTTTNTSLHVATLLQVQRMSLHCSKDQKKGIPRILQFLKLPKLTSLLVRTEPKFASPFPVLPITSFGEHLPNLAELSVMKVRAYAERSLVYFRSPSGAVLNYWVTAQPLGATTYRLQRRLWGGLPLHSVRRLTVVLHCREVVDEVWLVRLLSDLSSLEHLDLEGYCGFALRCLRRLIMQRDILIGIKTLAVRSGAYEIRQTMRLKEVAAGLGLEITVACIHDPGVAVIDEWPSDGESEDWDLKEEDGSEEQ